MAAVPALIDQSVPPHGTWVAEPDPFAEDRGQMVWQPSEPDGTPRGPLNDQPHDTGVWRMGPGQIALWFPTVDEET